MKTSDRMESKFLTCDICRKPKASPAEMMATVSADLRPVCPDCKAAVIDRYIEANRRPGLSATG